jgi:hypothetical protein
MKTVRMYNDQVVIEFDEDSHTYFKGEYAIPGVTTVCGMLSKPFLVPWAAKTCGDYLLENWDAAAAIPTDDKAGKEAFIKDMKGAHKRLAQKGADAGTLAHNWIERFIRGADEAPPEDEQASKAVGAFMNWWHNNHVVVHASEQIIFSQQHFYAGTVDLLATVNGVLTLADFKTSNNIYKDMDIQLAAYAMAMQEMGYTPPEKWMIINIQKDGTLQTANFDHDHMASMKCFLGLLEAYKWNRDAPRPKVEKIQ